MKLADKTAGLGYRREIAAEFATCNDAAFDFIEVAPENWVNIGGKYKKQLDVIAERFPMTLHGLSLNLGGYIPLDQSHLRDIKRFMTDRSTVIFSEHLSYCADHGHLYDLMPIPFREDAIANVVERIQRVQDFLGQKIAVENVSAYAMPSAEMSEIDFLREVLARADCNLLLDVNNVYVNSVNHGFDAEEYLAEVPKDRVVYYHVAGHFQEEEHLLVDTHGAPVIDPVWTLLDKSYNLIGVKPTLLERDFNFPKMEELLSEIDQIRTLQQKN